MRLLFIFTAQICGQLEFAEKSQSLKLNLFQELSATRTAFDNVNEKDDFIQNVVTDHICFLKYSSIFK